MAERHGATILRNEPVTAIDFASDGVTVATARERYGADRAVLAVGAWMPDLAGMGVGRRLRIFRQQLIWLDIDGDPAWFEPGACPVFIWEQKQGAHGIYGFPAIDGPRGGVKIATEQFTTETTADAADAPFAQEAIAAFFSAQVAPFIRGVAARCVKAQSCLYTVTPDFGFVIDAHPESERALIVSACSGHGFKHSPAIGEAAAAWAVEGRPPFEHSALRLARFG
jgi:sarcosine oxidase